MILKRSIAATLVALAIAEVALAAWPAGCIAAAAAARLAADDLLRSLPLETPADNAAFAPPSDARPAPALSAVLTFATVPPVFYRQRRSPDTSKSWRSSPVFGG